jgi:uncharacterized membrane protein YesL
MLDYQSHFRQALYDAVKLSLIFTTLKPLIKVFSTIVKLPCVSYKIQSDGIIILVENDFGNPTLYFQT